MFLGRDGSSQNQYRLIPRCSALICQRHQIVHAGSKVVLTCCNRYRISSSERPAAGVSSKASDGDNWHSRPSSNQPPFTPGSGGACKLVTCTSSPSIALFLNHPGLTSPLHVNRLKCPCLSWQNCSHSPAQPFKHLPGVVKAI